MPATKKQQQQQLNTTLPRPPRKKSEAQLRKLFWGDTRGNQLLNKK